MVADEGGPGARVVLHQPRGSQPDAMVCQGMMAEEAANFREATRLLGAARGSGGRTQALGLLDCMLGVADAMRQAGGRSLALVMVSVAVEVRTRVLGAEHLDTVRAIHNLGKALWAIGDLPGVREVEEQVVGLRTRVLGAEIPCSPCTTWPAP
jgi:hypothetical protein